MLKTIKMEDTIIRNAVKDDFAFIAEVVVMALGSGKEHPLYDIFCELAAREDTQYSYRNTLIAENRGCRVGAIVAYDGALLHSLRHPLLELIEARMGYTMNIENETEAGEYYFDSLAVIPSHRGMGIGALLLKAMRDKALSEGHKRIGLLVDFDNPKAEKLYSSLGFERINETAFLGHRMWHMQYSDVN